MKQIIASTKKRLEMSVGPNGQPSSGKRSKRPHRKPKAKPNPNKDALKNAQEALRNATTPEERQKAQERVKRWS
jgi:hypothetical protein